MTHEEAHQLARDRGVSRPLYAVVRFLAGGFMRVWFRLSISGAEHVPASGAVSYTHLTPVSYTHLTLPTTPYV